MLQALFERIRTRVFHPSTRERHADRDKNMEYEFDVKISAGTLYDYMLHHAYTSFTGLFGTIIGVFCLFGFFRNHHALLLIAGIVIILYLPCSMFLRAQQQARLTPAFQKPLHYKMTDEGVEVSQDGVTQFQEWDKMVKAISTGQSIILYTAKNNASIFPRKELDQDVTKVIEVISTHMPPSKVKIRY